MIEEEKRVQLIMDYPVYEFLLWLFSLSFRVTAGMSTRDEHKVEIIKHADDDDDDYCRPQKINILARAS